MTAQEISTLLAGGVDAESALKLLMNKEKIYRKYLYRFADDKNCETFLEAAEQQDIESAFRAVHTLKGTSANVGALEIARIADELTELLRPAREAAVFDFSQLRSEADRLFQASEAARNAILQVRSQDPAQK